MKIINLKYLILGFALIIITIPIFDSMNYADGLKEENCEKVIGLVSNIKKIGGLHQKGWVITFSNLNYKLSIIGETYQSINHAVFETVVKAGNEIDIYVLEASKYTIINKVTNSKHVKTPVAITYNGILVLSSANLRSNLGHIFIICLVTGALFFLLGLKFICISIKL